MRAAGEGAGGSINETAFQETLAGLAMGFAASTGTGGMPTGPVPEGQALGNASAIAHRHFADALDGFEAMEGVDHGGDDIVGFPLWNTSPGALAGLCAADPGCVAFNSNGYVKREKSVTRTGLKGVTFYVKK